MEWPNRMIGLETKAGLKPGTLTDVWSGNPQKMSTALREFDALAQRVKTKPDFVFSSGEKTGYYVRSIDGNKGIGYIEYQGRPQTLMNAKLSNFEKMFPK